MEPVAVYTAMATAATFPANLVKEVQLATLINNPTNSSTLRKLMEKVTVDQDFMAHRLNKLYRDHRLGEINNKDHIKDHKLLKDLRDLRESKEGNE